ncbi:MAG: SPOR domain-containing protein [Deltaproteobacteria bacterium]|nr:SPOR domain-containing protein [Deltaproteobacteria bacterium]
MAGGGDSRFRFELTRLELAGLIVSTAASLFIVFLLGIYAGRGIGDRQLDDAERVVRLPVAPAAAEETPAAEQDLTFDDTLGDDDHPTRVAGAVGAHAAAPAAEHGAPPGAAVEAAGGVHERAAAERSDAPRTPASGRTPEARVAVALVAPHASASPPAAALPPSTAGGEWSVQVTATREPRTADDLVKRLRARGYEAYIVRTRRDGAMFYRVRVGHFPSMERATQMVSRLRHEPGVPEAFVASD